MKKILIVDDEKEIVSLLGRSLELSGFSVISAENGKEAVNSAKTERPDLIVLDLALPDAEEINVAEKLKEDSETNW